MFNIYSDILDPDYRKEYDWHTKQTGDPICYTCGCDTIRAGVRHRRTVHGEGYEKIIKVCFGTDSSIEVIKPKGGTL